ncbi:hypothetical protein BGZ63DRAFT_422128 [Mariannaea sp. PMI_226]|nr:hypothetical protein BGZ63DRAFT_422128 [Mariannaea sp. PMI_226]
MKTRNRQQPPNGAQAPACEEREPDTQRYRAVMDKYSEMLSENETIALVRSAAADAISWVLIAGNVALPAATSYLRNACVLEKVGTVASFFAGTVGRVPLGLLVFLACVSIVIGLSWFWWLCKKSLGWLAYRILLSILVNTAMKLIPLPASLSLDQNLAITTVASLARISTTALIGGSAYIVYGIISRYWLKRDA